MQLKVLTQDSRLQEIFDLIPDEIWMKIFSYLDAGSRSRSAIMCKFWKKLTDDRKLWQLDCKREKIDVPEGADPKAVFIAAFKAEIERRSKMTTLQIIKEDIEKGKQNPVKLFLFASPAWSGH